MKNEMKDTDVAGCMFGGFCILLLGGAAAFVISIIVKDASAPVIITGAERIQILRMFMHNPGQYSYLIEKDGEIVPYFPCCETKVIADAQPGEPSYIIITKRSKNDVPYSSIAVVHIHSVADIDGAGWEKRQNKTTITGQTSVVE